MNCRYGGGGEAGAVRRWRRRREGGGDIGPAGARGGPAKMSGAPFGIGWREYPGDGPGSLAGDAARGRALSRVLSKL